MGADGKVVAVINQKAPDFSLIDTNGEAVELSALRGRTVLIDFWATWCSPCVASMPHLDEVHASETSLDVVVLAVNLENQQKAEQFMAENGYSFTSVVDTDKSVMRQYGVESIPITFLVDRFGILRKKIVGGSSISLQFALWGERFRRMMDIRGEPNVRPRKADQDKTASNSKGV